MAKVGQAKNGLMGGMSPGDQTVRAYTEVKAQMAESDRRPQRRDREGDDAQRDAGALQPDADRAGAGAEPGRRAGEETVGRLEGFRACEEIASDVVRTFRSARRRQA